MSYRGSIWQCMTYMADAFKTTKAEFLNLVCHPDSKYYSVETDNQIVNSAVEAPPGKNRLTMRVTLKELQHICDHPQKDLLKGGDNVTPPNDRN